MIDRFKELKREIGDESTIDAVRLDEEFVPPHKSAAFTPYDCVVCVTPHYQDVITSGDATMSEDEVSETVESMIQDIEYDRIVGTTENETSEPGDFLVYVSLQTFDEYKSEW